MDIYERVRRYAAEVVSATAFGAVARFESGERHDVFRVAYSDGVNPSDLVVRVSTRRGTADLAQSQREAAVLGRLDGRGAPRLYDYRDQSHWFDTPSMCLEFIDGDSRLSHTAAPQEVERLGTVVASVHSTAMEDLIPWFPGPTSISEYLEHWLELIASYAPRLRDPLPEPVRDRVPRAVALANAILERGGAERPHDDERLVLLHGDPGPGNILWREQPVLIDWEYARLGDPADEVAYLFAQHGLGSPQREAFWSGYRRSTTHPRLAAVVERAGWWEPVTMVGSALWWLERWSRRADADAAGTPDSATPKRASYYLDNAIRRLDRFDLTVDSVPMFDR